VTVNNSFANFTVTNGKDDFIFVSCDTINSSNELLFSHLLPSKFHNGLKV